MKILITGATGFIGSHLRKRLLFDGHTLVALVRDSTNIQELQAENVAHYVFNGNVTSLASFMNTEKFDGVIHLASLFLAQHKSEDVETLIDSNVLFSAILLEAAAVAHTSWFINTGTFWQHYENKSYSPVNLYAATKQAFEAIAQYYIETSPINFVTIKLSDTFGPNDTRPKVFNLWSKIGKSGEQFDMSLGEQLIDISFIDNVVDAYTKLIEAMSNDAARTLVGKSFAVRSQERMALKELAELFERVTNTTLNINWGKRDYRPREVMVPWEEGEIVPGWYPKISLEEGIRKTFND
jgi:nucleoside-diphosphate-sugar epimerase